MTLDKNKLEEIKDHENKRNSALLFVMLGIIFALIASVILSSCTSQARTQTQTRTVGVQAGQEVNISTTSTTLASETSGVDVAAVVSAAVQASQGKILGALDAIKPKAIPEDTGTDWGTLGGAGAATGLGLLLAWVKSREKKTIELDRDKIYDEHIELCKKLPPENTQKPQGG